MASASRYVPESAGSPQMFITKIRSGSEPPTGSTTNAPELVSRSTFWSGTPTMAR